MRALCAAVLAVVAGVGLSGCLGGPTKYESGAFADDKALQQKAWGYWKRDNFWGGLKGINKVAITQFSVEFVTENVNKSGASAISVLGAAEMLGVGRRKKVFAEEFKRDFPTVMYAGFVEALKAEGIEVVPMEAVTGHPAWAQLKTGADGGQSGFTARNLLGKADRSQTGKVQAYSVKGLPVIDDGWFAAGNNALAEGNVIGDTGGQAGLRIRMRVGLDDDGRAVLDAGSTIHVMHGMAKENWRGKGPEWGIKDRHNVVGSGAMRDDVPVITGKEFQAFKGDIYTIDTPRFQESIMKMYPTYVRMAAKTLKGA